MDDTGTRKRKELVVINTNARSLAPKIDSLLDCFDELSVDIAVVTETWFRDGPDLSRDLEDLEHGAAVSTLVRCRPPNPSTGVSHGGVAILYKKRIGRFKEIPINNPESYEILPAVGTITGTSRKLVLIASYMPPNYTAARAASCIQFTEDLILDMKRRFRDPLIILSGDFNQWQIQEAVEEFADFSEVPVGPTRNGRSIDRMFSNMSRSVQTSGTVPPLEAESSESDHRVSYASFDLPRREAFEWITYSYRHYTEEACRDFGSWIVAHDWSDVWGAVGSDAKALAYQADIDAALDAFFPMRTVRKKSTDLPWINKAVRKKIRRRNKIYRKEGRSELWKYLKKLTDDLIKSRKKVYMERKKQQLVEKDAARGFFRLVKSFSTPEKPQTFDVRSLRPGATDGQVADELADYFNRISAEFDPLLPEQIPLTKNRHIAPLAAHEVAARIKRFRKPKSMVKGDVFPQLVTKFSDFFAMPLTDIYNEIASSGVWPQSWKVEYVTVIPKVSSPSDFGDLRNISCTLLVSKIMESFVLDWAGEEVAVKFNQYGGVKGCGASHLIIKVWHKIMKNLEDRRAGTLLTSIDYAKAFNRLSFQHCLAAFARHGSSNQVLRLLATFLTDRTMQVRVGSTWSSPREVTGGVPQGSILGVFLFNVATDDLEDGSAFVKEVGRPELASGEEEDEEPEPVGQRMGWGGSQISTTSEDSDASFHTAVSSLDQDDVFESTPVGRDLDRPPQACSLSPVTNPEMNVRLDESDFVQPRRRIIYSSEGDITPPPEPTTTCLGPWTAGPVEVDKYVDDNLQEESVNFENAVAVLVNGESVKIKHAVKTQNVFRHVIRRAEERGMKVNTAKTGLLCVSDSLNHKTRAYIQDSEGARIESGEKLKVLGWHFSTRPTVEAHVEVLRRRFRERYWILRHLKHNGFEITDLVTVYTTMVRPVADYMMEVYHSMLTDWQDEAIERLQTHALKCIFGPRISGRKMRDLAGLTTLRQRRIEYVDKFAGKCAASDRFEDWFPEREGGRSTRKREKYIEEFARCDRLFNSPIYYMRRRLNGKPGKTYGARNSVYRQ